MYARFFPIQKGLDDTILKEKNIKDVDSINKVLALIVEIGEMANETRCFKYWSHKPASEKNVILEEYADCMHFLLGIGNDYGYSRSLDPYVFRPDNEEDLTTAIYDFVKRVVFFREVPNVSSYLDIWDAFLQVGTIIGFKDSEIREAYLKKNKKNLERQVNGY